MSGGEHGEKERCVGLVTGTSRLSRLARSGPSTSTESTEQGYGGGPDQHGAACAAGWHSVVTLPR